MLRIGSRAVLYIEHVYVKVYVIAITYPCRIERPFCNVIRLKSNIFLLYSLACTNLTWERKVKSIWMLWQRKRSDWISSNIDFSFAVFRRIVHLWEKYDSLGVWLVLFFNQRLIIIQKICSLGFTRKQESMKNISNIHLMSIFYHFFIVSCLLVYHGFCKMMIQFILCQVISAIIIIENGFLLFSFIIISIVMA